MKITRNIQTIIIITEGKQIDRHKLNKNKLNIILPSNSFTLKKQKDDKFTSIKLKKLQQ